MSKSKSKIILWGVISFFVVLAVVVGVIAIVYDKKEKKENETPPVTQIVWDGVTTIRPTGSGTETSPYLISRPEHLAYMATEMTFDVLNYTNSYFEQVADLDMGGHDWSPIGNSGTNMFSGQYNGNHYLIKNIGNDEEGYYSDVSKQAPSLFGIARTARISNIVIDYSFDSAVGTIAFGGIVRESYGGVTIIGCGNVTENLTFSDCNSNYGYGGILGWSRGRTDIESCYSLTSFNVSGSKVSVGGIAGRFDDFNVASGKIKILPKIKDSYYAGKIITTNVGNETDIQAGEIVGRGYSAGYCKLSSTYTIYNLNGENVTSLSELRQSLSSNWVSDVSVNNGLPVLKKDS